RHAGAVPDARKNRQNGVSPAKKTAPSSPLPFLMSRQAQRRSAAGAGQSQSTRRGTNPRPYVGRQAINGEHVMSDFRLLIDGKLVEGAGTLDVINPATGWTLTAAPRADQAQLDQAVAAAKIAFPIWSATPLRQRAALLVKLAEALEAEQGA